MSDTPATSRWLARADEIPATEQQLREVLDLGRRCVDSECLTDPTWRGLVAGTSKGPRTVSALRDLIAALVLYTAGRSPQLEAELRKKNDQLATLLRMPDPPDGGG